MTDTKQQVGETAGVVWQLLSSTGPQTLVQLKKKVNSNPEVLDFAIGWLAREDKIEITPEKKNLRIQLK